MKSSDFFNTDYVDFASYDNLRKIASVMDGQKNAARKVLYYTLERNVTDEIKVSQLGSKVAEYAEYLHGNMDGVIVNLGQGFTGTNNIPLMAAEGNFGTRFAQEASASRYIFTHGTEDFFRLFNKEDAPILVEQTFEGNKIEPRFYVPELPILLINGSEGVSSGFAQKILPRAPGKIKKAIMAKLDGKKIDRNWLVPYYHGFKGTITQGDTPEQWVISGLVERLGANKVEIIEVPIGYDLRDYLDVLDDLEDKKIIQSYVDKSEDDNFHFVVNINSKTLKEWDDQTLLTRLKLVKRVTENYTVMDEENRIREFDSAEELLDHYIEIKRLFLQKRKAYKIQKLSEDISLEQSRYAFVNAIVSEKLIINKRKKTDIENDLKSISGIVEFDGSYDYLLNMNILSLTQERLERLKKSIETKGEELKEIEKKTIDQMWMETLT